MKQDDIVLKLKYNVMGRVKKLRNMDGLIIILETIITKSQCSLSAQDLIILNDAIAKLQILKKKKGLTDKHLQHDVVIIVQLISEYLTRSDLR